MGPSHASLLTHIHISSDAWREGERAITITACDIMGGTAMLLSDNNNSSTIIHNIKRTYVRICKVCWCMQYTGVLLELCKHTSPNHPGYAFGWGNLAARQGNASQHNSTRELHAIIIKPTNVHTHIYIRTFVRHCTYCYCTCTYMQAWAWHGSEAACRQQHRDWR